MPPKPSPPKPLPRPFPPSFPHEKSPYPSSPHPIRFVAQKSVPPGTPEPPKPPSWPPPCPFVSKALINPHPPPPPKDPTTESPKAAREPPSQGPQNDNYTPEPLALPSSTSTPHTALPDNRFPLPVNPQVSAAKSSPPPPAKVSQSLEALVHTPPSRQYSNPYLPLPPACDPAHWAKVPTSSHRLPHASLTPPPPEIPPPELSPPPHQKLGPPSSPQSPFLPPHDSPQSPLLFLPLTHPPSPPQDTKDFLKKLAPDSFP